MSVKIVDTIMGGGKTSAAINFINESKGDIRFLYITPYLDEVKRVRTSCASKHFVSPEEKGGKLNRIRELFEKGNNIASTHKLFSMFDCEIIDIVRNKGYVLIMDEVADVVDILPISSYDRNVILDNFAHIDENGMLTWHMEDYNGEYNEYKRQCDLGCVGIYNDAAILWMFPVSTFRAFEDVYILTYLFPAQIQKYYYDYYKIDYSYLYVEGDNIDNYRFTDDKSKVSYKPFNYRELIDILDNDKLNAIGDFNTDLSASWYKRNKSNSVMCRLRLNCINYFYRYAQTPSCANLWTTFKDYRKQIAGKGYARGFLSSSARATNAYRDRTSIAYLINKFFNPYVKGFFTAHGIEVNEDMYAVSELLQFLFRSAIRDGNPIQLYIPSKRMRELLIDWINSFDYIEDK